MREAYLNLYVLIKVPFLEKLKNSLTTEIGQNLRLFIDLKITQEFIYLK